MADGNIDYSPDPVPGYNNAPVTEGPPTTPPPLGGGAASFMMPIAPRATTMNTSTRFIEIDYNGNIITTAVTSMNFTGAGVNLTNSNSAVTIDIPGSDATPSGPNNSVQINNDGSLAGSADLVFANGVLAVSGNVEATYIAANGSRLTNIAGPNVAGYVPLAQYANTAGNTQQSNIANVALVAYSISSANIVGNVANANRALTANIANVAYRVFGPNVFGPVASAAYSDVSGTTYSILAANVVGTVDSATNATNAVYSTSAGFAQNSNVACVAGIVTNSAQNAITSVGTLTSLLVTGNITTNGYILGNGSQLTGLPATYGNANVTAYLPTNTANVGGNYFIGNGSKLSNLNAANIVGEVANATYATTAGTAVNSTVAVLASAVTNSSQGNITSLGTLIGLNVNGNVAATNYFGNGRGLTGIAASNITGTVANAAYATLAQAATQATDAINAVTATTAGTVTANAQLNITSVGTLTSLNVTGNTTSGNLRTAGIISAAGNIVGGNVTATGNIRGSYVYGNGYFLTGIANGGAGNYGNVDVANYLSSGDVSSNIVTTGNVTGTYFLGDGSQLTGLPATYGNSNVVTLLAGFGSNTISTTGNITASNLSTTGNVLAGNLNSLGTVTSAGLNAGIGNITTAANISGSYFIGNGSQLTGINASTYGNSNVTTLLAGFGSNTISTTGNITAGNFIGGGAGTPTLASATNLDLSAAAAVRVIGGGTFRLPSLTTAQIANVVASNGDMVYNSTTANIQAYANGAWGNLTLT